MPAASFLAMLETMLPAEAIPAKAKIDRLIKPNRINFFKDSPPDLIGSVVVLQTTQLSTTLCSNDIQKVSPCQVKDLKSPQQQSWNYIVPNGN